MINTIELIFFIIMLVSGIYVMFNKIDKKLMVEPVWFKCFTAIICIYVIVELFSKYVMKIELIPSDYDGLILNFILMVFFLYYTFQIRLQKSKEKESNN